MWYYYDILLLVIFFVRCVTLNLSIICTHVNFLAPIVMTCCDKWMYQWCHWNGVCGSNKFNWSYGIWIYFLIKGTNFYPGVCYIYIEMEELTGRICWELVKKEGYIAIWRKPLDNRCYINRDPGVQPPLCDPKDDPNSVW